MFRCPLSPRLFSRRLFLHLFLLQHWTDFWGKVQAGPFNTDCLAKPGAHTHPTGHTCIDVPQKLPPVPTATATAA